MRWTRRRPRWPADWASDLLARLDTDARDRRRTLRTLIAADSDLHEVVLAPPALDDLDHPDQRGVNRDHPDSPVHG
ncbi:hypothetical protein [Streptomyces sp. NPDC001492]